MASPDALFDHLVSLAAWVGRAGAGAAITAGLVFVLQVVVGRWLTPAWRYRLWGLVVLRLLMPALPASPASISNLLALAGDVLAKHALVGPVPQAVAPNVASIAALHARQPTVAVTYVIASSVAAVPSEPASDAAASADHASSVALVLTGVWLLVTLLLLLRLIASNVSLARRLRYAVPVMDPGVLALLNDCRRALGVSRPARLVVTDAVRVPAAAGAWRAQILLPLGLLEQLSYDERRAILLHELAHIRCRDVAMNWMLALVGTVHWFNPAVRLSFARLRADREVARDAMVLRVIAPGRTPAAANGYAQILLKLTESLSSVKRQTAVAIAGIVTPQNSLLPAFFSGRSILQRRIRMIEQFTTKARRRSLLGPVLALLLAGMTLTRAEDPAPIDALAPSAPAEKHRVPATQPGQSAIDLLDRTLPAVSFDAVGLGDAIDFLRDITKADIFVNWKALEAEGVNRKTPLTARLRQIKCSKALEIILDSVGAGQRKLGFTVVDNVIMISTLRDLQTNTITRVYDIRDLLVNVPDFDPKDTTAPGTQPASGGAQGDLKAKERVNLIIQLIEDVVASDTWKDRGGVAGNIRELQGQLIITQMAENQASIAKLLDQLRETRGIQVQVEARFISCDEQLAQMILAEWKKTGAPATQPVVKIEPATEPGRTGTVFFLNDTQVGELLRASQDSPGAALLAAPRLTLFNGQRAYVQVTSEHSYVRDFATVHMPDGQTRYDPIRASVEPGLVMDVQATASADRKSITLTLRPKVSALLGMKQAPWSSRPAGSALVVEEPTMKASEIQTTINVPDKGTVVLGGMRDPGIPDLLPATQPAGNPRYLFLLVKPSLITPRESDEKPAPSVKANVQH